MDKLFSMALSLLEKHAFDELGTEMRRGGQIDAV